MTRAPVSFLNKTYEDALALAVEARDYIAYQETGDYVGMKPGDRIVLSREAMRLTTMVTQVMAWVLVQKAVFAGEMSREEAAKPEHYLGAAEVCFDTSGIGFGPLPARLRELLDRGHGLYVRVARLDEMTRRQAS